MTLDVTTRAAQAVQRVKIEPQIVLQIDGVDTYYGAVEILETLKYDTPGVFYDGTYNYDDLIAIENQEPLISFSGGTTKTISQQLRPDKGTSNSISSMTIGMLDKEQKITKLVSPGEVVTDILGRKVIVWLGLGFADTAFKEDYVILFRGRIDDVVAAQGLVSLTINHPDNKKRQDIFVPAQTGLTNGIDSSQTTSITLDNVSDFLSQVTGPSGSPDTALRFVVQIDDEWIEYTTFSGNDLGGTVTRGVFGTSAASHDAGADVKSVYIFEDDMVNCALKLMMSGTNGNFLSGIDTLTNFNRDANGVLVANALYFQGIDVRQEYGIVEGDYITTTSASNGANNVSLKTISSISTDIFGSLVVINGVSFVDETDTSATISFRSQYDTLGEGLAMGGDEVDVDEHIRWRDLILTSFSYRFYLKDVVNGQDFLENQIYKPYGAYAVARKAKASMGYTFGPIPGETVKVLDQTNIKGPNKLKTRRSTHTNFYNTIIHQFDEDTIGDRFLRGVVTVSATSKNQVPVGTKARKFLAAKGIRSDLAGVSNAGNAANNLLNRYKFGAESIENLNVLFRSSFDIEIGDLILLDSTNLNLINTTNADRSARVRFWEVVNKMMNWEKGQVSLSLVDTQFDGSLRVGLISPASYIGTAISTTQFVIKESFSSKYGVDEYRKWENLIGASVLVRKTDFSSSDTAVIESISGNTITLDSALSFTPAVDDLMELDEYDNQPDIVKQLYAFLSDGVNDFADGGSFYGLI